MNAYIHKLRDVALKILNPTKKELEYGLKLHAESLICDSYGFSPYSVVPASIINVQVKSGLSFPEMQDLQEDIMMTNCIVDKEQQAEYIQAQQASGVTCIFQNAGEEHPSVKQIIKRLARFTYVTDTLKPQITKAVTPDDIIKAKEQNRYCLCFSSNAVPLKEEWNSIRDELSYIRILFQFGVRMMHLTYNRRNMLGDGCVELANAGLSDLGRQVITEMNRVGVVIDVAHSGQQTSFEAAKVSSAPVVASHSGAYYLNSHPRNKQDKVIRSICDSGGYVGVCCIPAFLGLTGNINAFLQHIDYLKKKFGSEHVSIGTDVGYEIAKQGNKESENKHSAVQQPKFSSFWPKDEAAFDKKWCETEMVQSLAWTNWPLFTVGLVKLGYKDEDIRKIVGGNVIRVLKSVALRKNPS